MDNHYKTICEPTRSVCSSWRCTWINRQKIFGVKRARTCHLLCKKPGFYHSASKTHVGDRIFKLNSIHTSVIYQIPWIHWIQFHLGNFTLFGVKIGEHLHYGISGCFCKFSCFQLPVIIMYRGHLFHFFNTNTILPPTENFNATKTPMKMSANLWIPSIMRNKNQIYHHEKRKESTSSHLANRLCLHVWNGYVSMALTG